MRWRRVLKYVAVLFGATFAVGFAFGFVEGFVQGAYGAETARGISPLLLAADALTVAAAATTGFGVTAYRAREQALAQASLVALVTWAYSFPLSVILLGQPAGVWALGGVFLGLFALVGFGAGLRALLARGASPEPA